MTISPQPGCCWGTATRLLNKPGSQKLTPFSSANEAEGNATATLSARAVATTNERSPGRHGSPSNAAIKVRIVTSSRINLPNRELCGTTLDIFRLNVIDRPQLVQLSTIR